MDMTDIFKDKKFRFDRQNQLHHLITFIHNNNKRDITAYTLDIYRWSGRCAPDQRRNCAQSGGWFGASASQPPLERKNQMNELVRYLISDQFRRYIHKLLLRE